MRLTGILTEFAGFIPQGLTLRSIVFGCSLIYQNWSIHINPFIHKIPVFILLTAHYTFHIFFYLSLTGFWNCPVAFFQDFLVLENATTFQDFPGPV